MAKQSFDPVVAQGAGPALGREKLTRSTFDFLRSDRVKALFCQDCEPSISETLAAECSTVTIAATPGALALVFSQQYCGTATNPKYTISCGWRYGKEHTPSVRKYTPKKSISS